MSHLETKHPKEKNISSRIDEESLGLISLAAKEVGLSRSAFMIRESLKKAKEILMDQSNYSLNQDQWHKFVSLIETPPMENENLRKLMKTKAPWER